MEASSEPKSGGNGRTSDKVVLLERFRVQMLATARRYSINSHDADDAYQRAAEILLTHSPTGTDDELCRWLRTTVKHEALAIRRQVDRVAPAGEPHGLPEPRSARRETAHDEAERSERLSLGAQALGRLKPQEVRCLLLKAEGYSYQEICERTGFSYTKVNRCLSEGRRAFLARVASIESGAECDRLSPHLSALADGEGTAVDLAAVRPHLKTCLACRARLREFRAVPARVAALAPAGMIGAPSADSAAPTARSFVESMVGAAQHKASALGDRAQHVLEMAGAQKAAAVAASAAALAGGGAVTAERLSERTGDRSQPAAKARPASQDLPAGGTQAEPALPPFDPAAPSPTAAPTPPPPPVPDPPAQPAAAPPPRPSNEFAPETATVPPPEPAPAPTPTGFESGGGAPSGGGGASSGGSGEFAP